MSYFKKFSIKKKILFGFSIALLILLLDVAFFASTLNTTMEGIRLSRSMEMLVRDTESIKYEKSRYLMSRDRVLSESIQAKIIEMHGRIQQIQNEYAGKWAVEGKLGVINNSLNIFRDSFQEYVALEDQSKALEDKAFSTASQIIVTADDIRKKLSSSAVPADRERFAQISGNVTEIVRLVMAQRWDERGQALQSTLALDESRKRADKIVSESKTLMGILVGHSQRLEAYHLVMLSREYTDIFEQYNNFQLLQKKSEDSMNANSDTIEFVSIQSVESIAKNLEDAIKLSIFKSILVLIVSILGVIGGGYVLANRLTNKMIALVEATKRIDEGHYEVEIKVEGVDELDLLAESINAMGAHLAADEAAGLLYNKRLESEVESRTQELQMSVKSLKEAQFKIIQNEKMAAVGQLISGITNEISGPLSEVHESAVKVQYLCDSILETLIRLIPRMDSQELSIFMDIVVMSESAFLTYSSKEDVAIRTHLQREVELKGVNTEKSFKIVECLMELGIYRLDGLEEVLDNPKLIEILELIRSISTLKRSVENMDVSASRATKVIHALKSFSYTDKQERMYEENLIDSIETALILFQSRLKKGVEVERDFGRLPLVECHLGEISQVWMNLIANAINAMGEVGKLRITAQYDGAAVIFAFKDTGVGVTPELKNQIFEPFVTTKMSEDGSGLGLDITRAIIEKHQGRIWFTSEPGETVFYVELPVRQSR